MHSNRRSNPVAAPPDTTRGVCARPLCNATTGDDIGGTVNRRAIFRLRAKLRRRLTLAYWLGVGCRAGGAVAAAQPPPPLDVNFPRPKRQEMAKLDEQQIECLLTTAERKDLFLPVLPLLTTGLRHGEPLGRKYSDLDRERKQLSIVHSLEETRTGSVFKAPKTARSARVLPLPDVAIERTPQGSIRAGRSQERGVDAAALRACAARNATRCGR